MVLYQARLKFFEIKSFFFDKLSHGLKRSLIDPRDFEKISSFFILVATCSEQKLVSPLRYIQSSTNIDQIFRNNPSGLFFHIFGQIRK